MLKFFLLLLFGLKVNLAWAEPQTQPYTQNLSDELMKARNVPPAQQKPAHAKLQLKSGKSTVYNKATGKLEEIDSENQNK